MKTLLASVLSLGLLIALCGCSGSSAEPTSYAEMLRWVPNEPEFRRQIWFTDYEVVRALPPATTTEAHDPPLVRMQDAARQHVGLEVTPPFGSQEAMVWTEIPEHWERGFGFAIDDIERTLATAALSTADGEVPGLHRLGLVAGTFDSDAVPDRLEACVECEPGELRSSAGQSYYHWPSDVSLDPDQRLKPPILDNLGRGGNIAFTDDHILFDLDEQTLQRALETHEAGGSVMEVPSFRLLAEELEDRSFVTVVLGDETLSPAWRDAMLQSESQSSPPAWYTAMYTAPFDPPLLRPYEALAIGWGLAESERYATVLLVHETPEHAEDNVPRLIARLEQTLVSVCTTAGDCDQIAWRDTLTGWEVEADGQLLIATLHGGIAGAGPPPHLKPPPPP